MLDPRLPTLRITQTQDPLLMLCPQREGLLEEASVPELSSRGLCLDGLAGSRCESSREGQGRVTVGLWPGVTCPFSRRTTGPCHQLQSFPGQVRPLRLGR